MAKADKQHEAESSKPDKPRVKRPDRAIKLAARKTSKETVIKAAVRNLLHGDNDLKDKIEAAFTDRVEAYSKRANLASLALSHIVKKALEAVDDVATVELPDVTDVTFIRQLFLGTEEAIKPLKLVADFYVEFPEYQRVDVRHFSDLNIYTAGAINYSTNVKNSLRMNLEPRIKKFAKQFATVEDLSKEEYLALLFGIHGWSLQPTMGCIYPARSIVYTEVAAHRRVLGMENGDTVSKGWLRSTSSLSKIMRYFVYLNRFKAAHGLPMFNIVPICGAKAHFVTIDTTSLFGIMREVGLIDRSVNLKAFSSLMLDQWASFLKYDKLQGAHNEFTGTIQTDGVSVCVHFTRPLNLNDAFNEYKPKAKKKFVHKNVVINKSDRVIGVDPGRSNIFYCAEPHENGKFRTFALTRQQYYNDSGIFKARRQTVQWTKGIQENNDRLASVSTKGVSTIDHEAYMSVYLEEYESIWTEYLKPRWARQRLRLYGGKKRTFARFFNRLQQADPSRPIKVAYGSASFAPGGRGEISVPTTRAYHEFAMRFPTIVVDEFRTTKVFHEDGSILGSVVRNDKNTAVRGLLWCGSTNNSKFVNRDLNGAVNIRRCVVSPVRPPELTRVSGQQAIHQRVGKYIKC
jgi:hypothetical protein